MSTTKHNESTIKSRFEERYKFTLMDGAKSDYQPLADDLLSFFQKELERLAEEVEIMNGEDLSAAVTLIRSKAIELSN